MATKRVSKKEKTYSFDEAQAMFRATVDESAERLRKRLRASWKKQARAAQTDIHVRAQI